MSREVKFRAFVPELSKSVDVFAVNPMNQTVYLSATQLYASAGDDILMKYGGEPDQVKLQQYTGLKDKNGVEIYEGDVLEYRDHEYSFRAAVEWGDNGYVMPGHWIGGGKDNFNFDDNDPEELEVIGNIYENPELLGSRGGNE